MLRQRRVATRLYSCWGTLLALMVATAWFVPRLAAQGPQPQRPLPSGAVQAEASPPRAAADEAVLKAKVRLAENYGKLPLRFEANQGQTDQHVRFLSRGNGYALFLTGDEAVLSLRQPPASANAKLGTGSSPLGPQNPSPETRVPSLLRMKLVGATASAQVVALDELPGRSNYFHGNDPAKWRTNVPNYGQVKYQGVYPGVDLVYYGNQRQLEYDFVVAPGADPQAIRFAVETGNSKLANADLRIDAAGDLVISTEGGEVRFHKPTIYQLQDSGTRSRESGPKDEGLGTSDNRRSPIGNRQFLDGRFKLLARNQVGFEIPSYDKSKPLVIDPTLSYERNLGGTSNDYGYAVAVDSSGSAYLTGPTTSSDFPASAGAYDTTCGTDGNCDPIVGATFVPVADAFVAKLSADGNTLIYATFLGGSGADEGYGIAVDSLGNAYITGGTYSTDFPTSASPFQPSSGGAPDAFVAKLSAAGDVLVYSSYLGGSADDFGNGIALDQSGNGNAYVTGQTNSTNFPTTSAMQGSNAGMTDAFVTEVSADGSTEVYSTYLGGSGTDYGAHVAVDASGSAYVTGSTNSTDFPVTPGVLQDANGGTAGTNNVFITKLNADGSAKLYSTYLGGSDDDSGRSIAVDSYGNAYVTGLVTSLNFPVAASFMQFGPGGGQDIFVSKINSVGSAQIYTAILGGANVEAVDDIKVDWNRSAYIVGVSESPDYPLTSPLQGPETAGNCDGSCGDIVVSKINPSGNALIFSTYLGGDWIEDGTGIALDTNGNPSAAYVVGETNSTTSGGTYDAYAAKLTGLVLPVGYLNPTSLDFGDAGVGVTSPQRYVYIENRGDATLSVTSAVADGVFNVASNTCTSVVAWSSCYIGVTVTPVATGSTTGTLTITDNTYVSQYDVSLSATGIPVPVVGFSVSSLDFGNQRVGTTSASQSVTVTNNGTAVMTITDISTYGDFDATHDCPISPDTLAIGGTCTIDVTFTPTAVGTQGGQVTVSSDAPNSGNYVTLTGTGIASAVRPAHRFYYFAELPVGSTSAPQTVTLTNTGDASLTVSSVVPSGDFGVAGGTCTSGSIAPGANCTVDVTFTPTAVNRREGSLTINSDAPDTPATVGLIGASALRLLTEFTTNILPANDDGSTGLIPLPFTVNFFGNSYTGLYVNNNGNVTFDSSLSTYTPFGLTTNTDIPIIAPFFADVDTRGLGSDVVTYGVGTVDGRQAFGVNWINVGYFGGHADKLNSFQLVLIDRSDTGAGNFDIEMNYGLIQWETGDASGGSGGFGGYSARAGYSNGTGDAGTFYELDGSGVNGAFLDSNTQSGLVYRGVNGRAGLIVRAGEVVSVVLSPTAVHFTGNPLNLDCDPKLVTMTNAGQAPVTIQDISFPAGSLFSQTNNCPTSAALAAGGYCTISIKFHPIVVGPASDTLSVTTSVVGAPSTVKTVAASGNGTPPCALLASPHAVTVLRGAESAGVDIEDQRPSCSPVDINLTCSPDHPALCALNPAVIAPSGASRLTVSNLRAVEASSVRVVVNSVSEFRTAATAVTVLLADFAFTSAPDEATVAAGQTANYSLTVRPVNGLTGPVSLACSGAPRGARCTLTPASITLDGASLVPVKLQVTTTARAAAPVAPWGLPPLTGRWGLTLLGLLAMLLAAGAVGLRRRRLTAVLLAGTLLMLLGWAACGGGGGGGTFSSGSSGTPMGGYALTVTGTYTSTSGSTPATLTKSATVTLHVD